MITVVPMAAGKTQGTIQFDVGPADQTGWGGVTLERTQRSIEVNVVRVDEIVDRDTPIALLKVDIEGADTWALMGCERLLASKTVQEIWYEQNKPRMAELGIPLSEAQNFLQSLGYQSLAQNDPNDELVEWCAVPR
jgi:hypothetical protein